MAKISVIIPVYNVAPYLDQCLRSLANQTFQDTEYLLIDDGSTDESGTICDQWAAHDSRFVVIHKENGGVSSARNLGLERASGEYIGFADSDDWLEPDALEHMNHLLDAHPDAQIACAGFYEHEFGCEKPPSIRPDNPSMVFGVTNTETTIRNLLVRNGYWGTIWNKLFRRESVFSGGVPYLFNTDLHFGEDENWILNIMTTVPWCVCSPKPVYHYRVRTTSVTHRNEITPRILSILDAYTESVNLLHDISPELERIASGRKYNDTFTLQVRAYCFGQTEALRMIRKKLAGTWLQWLLSPQVLLLRKAKVMVVRGMMFFHLPPAWIQFVYDIKRRHKEMTDE